MAESRKFHQPRGSVKKLKFVAWQPVSDTIRHERQAISLGAASVSRCNAGVSSLVVSRRDLILSVCYFGGRERECIGYVPRGPND